MNTNNPTATRTLGVGWTISDREAGYIAFTDGYQPFAKQHTEVITVDLPAKLRPDQIPDLVFIATNAPELDAGSPEALIRDAIAATGYRGQQAAHYSLSVGDTVTVDGRKWECKPAGWKLVEEEGK